ncbi:MAG: hypothetical protein M3R46_11115 [Actinomycetota bacterium]|nr:hypothetical protein [Actinomycetota bacterium]
MRNECTTPTDAGSATPQPQDHLAPAWSDDALALLRTLRYRLGAADVSELAGALDRDRAAVLDELCKLEGSGLVEPILWRVTAEGVALARGGEA